MSTVIDLPRMISVNALWRIAGRRLIKSDEYREWLKECGWEIRIQKPRPVEGNYRLHIEALKEGGARRDIDNIIKAISDLLEMMKVISNDSLCDKVVCEWVSSGPPVRVTVAPIED